MPPKTLTVIVPTYVATPRSLEDLRACLTSILSQRFTDFDLWVIDDQSPPDPTGVNPIAGLLQQLQDPRVHFRSLETRAGGPARGRNRGVDETNSPWLAFCDQDDLWLPEKLERQMALAAKNPGLMMIHTNAQFLFADGSTKDLQSTCPIAHGEVSVASMMNAYTIFSTVCIRRELFQVLGGLDEETTPCDDTDLFLKLGERRCRVGFIAELCAQHRLSPQSLSADRLAIRAKKIRVFEKALERPQTPADRAFLQQLLERTLGQQAFALFNVHRHTEALTVLERLARQGRLSWKGNFYRFFLQRKKPQAIWTIRKWLSVLRGR